MNMNKHHITYPFQRQIQIMSRNLGKGYSTHKFRSSEENIAWTLHNLPNSYGRTVWTVCEVYKQTTSEITEQTAWKASDS